MTITHDTFTNVTILTRGNHISAMMYLGKDIDGFHTFAVQRDDEPVEHLAHLDFHYVAHVAYKWARQQVRYNYHATEER